MKLYKYKIILPNGKKLIQEANYFDTRTGDANIYFFKKDHMVAVVPNGSAVIEIGYEDNSFNLRERYNDELPCD